MSTTNTTKIDYVALVKAIVLSYIDKNKYRVFLFGSRACGNARKFSDIDVGIMGNEALSSIVQFEIEQAIDESIVPFKVDLVDFFNVDSTFKKEVFKKIEAWN